MARKTALLAAVAGLAGCSVQSPDVARGTTGAVSGSVHGGQQPVANSTIQLYAVGTSGDGSAATPLLTRSVTTDAGGNFSITGAYSCANATLVYLTATGGSPGAGAANPNLALMTVLGPCSSLSASTFIMMNEVTTVAAVAALAPYMTSPAGVGYGARMRRALRRRSRLPQNWPIRRLESVRERICRSP